MLRVISNFSALKVASYTTGVRAFSVGNVSLLQTKNQNGKSSAAKKPATKKTTKAAAPKRPKKTKTPTKKELTEALIKEPKKFAPQTYALFVKEMSKDKALYSGRVTELARICSEKWSSMGESEKAKYHKEAEKLKAEHETYLRQWWSTVDPDLVALENQRRRRQQGSKARLMKDPFAPKRPATPFMLYVKEYVAKNKNTQDGQGIDSMQKLVKSASEEWNHMTATDKAAFNKAAEIEKTRYKQDMDKYRKSHAA
ncbi:hypothetical protein H4R22_003751 [Coemansia sp. RSA 1290]|nr:hypothetical protein H4R22_003751 [Coemansia sp. RSA 1290]KAJ2645809.1 hypothetical protein IWW40_005849 [Coemansia sp. RSA 1250]